MRSEIKSVEEKFLKKDIPQFSPGDTVAVHFIVREGERERIQVFQGIVLRRKGGGVRETFTVRKVSFGIGVERTFPLHSPLIKKIEILKKGKARRANLTYIRNRASR
ncbi:50S ribosomal protein L19 [Candidatus Aerophobetes bacterium]|uniref:50S ribosomal protein L19 n=1 Tax=Aerophobetes bacterium TaxID=2030807 RepID=A0A662DB03_UNCAE|nr:MAG: 50S ribosomal protein L19 [Candidatus Aerophobetes bacterium]